MDKSRRLLSFVRKFVKDASGSGESLQDRSASHQFAWRVEDDEVAGLQSAHQSLLTVAQLAEPALNGTEHVVVACDPNPMALCVTFASANSNLHQGEELITRLR